MIVGRTVDLIFMVNWEKIIVITQILKIKRNMFKANRSCKRKFRINIKSLRQRGKG